MTTLTLDVEHKRTFWGGHDIKLTSAEWRIVLLMTSRPGAYFTYRELYDALRDYPGFVAGAGEYGFQGNMRSAVKRLRRKFLIVDPTFDAIVNYQSIGYCWKRERVTAMSSCPHCGQPLRLSIAIDASQSPRVSADRSKGDIKE